MAGASAGTPKGSADCTDLGSVNGASRAFDDDFWQISPTPKPIGARLDLRHSNTMTVTFNSGPDAAHVDPIYAEALKLADAARQYFDGPGIAERAALPTAARTATALESLRITARLIKLVSWGLMHQAVRNREIAAATANAADRALAAPDADTALDRLPPRARSLAVASRDLYARAHGPCAVHSNPANPAPAA